MQRIWKQLGRHIDLMITAGISLCMAGMAYASINDKLTDHDKHLNAIDALQAKQTDQMNTTQQTTARTEQKVDDMADNITDIKQWLRNKR